MWPAIQSISPRSTTFKDNILILWSLLLWMSDYSKNKTCYKMQREKLYNLQTKVHFNCILLILKKTKTLCDRFVPLWKNHFFTHTRIPFSYFIFLSRNMLSLKKTKYTTRCSVKSSTVYKEQFISFLYFLCSKKL